MSSPRILFSEGTSLSSREAVTALGRSGRRVEICAPGSRCFGGWSKWVDCVHVMPAIGADPGGYVRAVAGLCSSQPIGVLLPVHEQAYLFAALRRGEPSWPAARTAVPVASFEAFEAVQTKSALASTLAAAGLPQPDTFVAASCDELFRHGEETLRSGRGCIVKTNSDTASVGMRRIADRRQLAEFCEALAAGSPGTAASGPWTEPVIVQPDVPGPLERLQAVFSGGKLAAIHCYRQLVAGLGGGDVLKESVSRPLVVSHMEALGARLRWHGALSFDYILANGDLHSPRYIDANPRLVEPVNALLSGVNLAEMLVKVALGEGAGSPAVGRAGVRTRLGIAGLSERAVATRSRRAVFGDFVAQLRGAGRYAGSAEELTPVREDARSAIPFMGILASLLIRPAAAADISRITIESYALGRRGHAFARRAAG